MNTYGWLIRVLLVATFSCNLVGCGETAAEKEKKIEAAAARRAEEMKREDACRYFEVKLKEARELPEAGHSLNFEHDGVWVSLKKLPMKEEMKSEAKKAKTPAEIFDSNLKEIRVGDRTGTIKFSVEDDVEVTLERKKISAPGTTVLMTDSAERKENTLLDLRRVPSPVPVIVEAPVITKPIEVVVNLTDTRPLPPPPVVEEWVQIFPLHTPPPDKVEIVIENGVVTHTTKPGKYVSSGHGYAFTYNEQQIITIEKVDRVEQKGIWTRLYITGQSVPAITNGKVYVSPVRPTTCPNCPPERS